jgi:hypothetical protein
VPPASDRPGSSVCRLTRRGSIYFGVEVDRKTLGEMLFFMVKCRNHVKPGGQIDRATCGNPR